MIRRNIEEKVFRIVLDRLDNRLEISKEDLSLSDIEELEQFLDSLDSLEQLHILGDFLDEIEDVFQVHLEDKKSEKPLRIGKLVTDIERYLKNE